MAKIKVSQKTIDQIKKMGMTKALGSASSNKSAEFQEGLRRMYGQRRLSKAMGSSAKGVGQPVGGVMGTSRAQVMSGPVRSTKKVSPEAKTVKAFRANTGQRVNDYRQNLGASKAQQAEASARVKAMAPAERRAYYGTQAKKAAGLTAAVVSAVPLGAAGVSAMVGSRVIGGAVKAASVASKTKKGIAAAKTAAAKNVPPRSYAGIKTTAGLGAVAGIAGSGKKKK
jgi:hypothetical protein